MTSYKHEKENIGYPITSIEIEKDTSEPAEEELEKAEKPIKQTPGYSRIFEFDATLKSFLYKYSQEIENKIKEFVNSINWKNLNKDEIINYINKTIEKFKDHENFEKIINNYPSLIENIAKIYLLEKIKRDFSDSAEIDKNKSLEELINYINDLSSKDIKSDVKEIDDIIEKWNELKDEWPLIKLLNFKNSSITINPDLIENINILEKNTTYSPSEIIKAYTILSNLLVPIQLDDVYGYLVDKKIS